MTELRFTGIPENTATEVRGTMRSPQYGHPAHRELASGYGPCRLCLRTFEVGEEDRILFTYQPFETGILPSPGPIFVHAEPCERYDSYEFPPDLRDLPLVLESYGTDGSMVSRERLTSNNPENALAELFRHEDVKYVHIRNGEAGCFVTRVDSTNQ